MTALGLPVVPLDSKMAAQTFLESSVVSGWRDSSGQLASLKGGTCKDQWKLA